MALTTGGRYRLVELVLAAYGAVITVIALARAPAVPGNWGIALAHALIILLVWLVSRPGLGPAGRFLRDVAPLLLLLGLYGALDVLNAGGRPVHDAAVLRWEAALFGGQPARDWWRAAPSRFWSTLLHGVYVSNYLLLAIPAVAFAARRDWPALRRFVRNVMVTFALCFVVFALLPVTGPYYQFERPAGPFVETWTAKLVYAALATGSSYGAAFPSSHVAATTAAGLAAWAGWRPLGLALALPVALMPIATVYCQMHYAVDAIAGLALGLIVPLACERLEPAIPA